MEMFLTIIFFHFLSGIFSAIITIVDASIMSEMIRGGLKDGIVEIFLIGVVCMLLGYVAFSIVFYVYVLHPIFKSLNYIKDKVFK